MIFFNGQFSGHFFSPKKKFCGITPICLLVFFLVFFSHFRSFFFCFFFENFFLAKKIFFFCIFFHKKSCPKVTVNKLSSDVVENTQRTLKEFQQCFFEYFWLRPPPRRDGSAVFFQVLLPLWPTMFLPLPLVGTPQPNVKRHPAVLKETRLICLFSGGRGEVKSNQRNTVENPLGFFEYFWRRLTSIYSLLLLVWIFYGKKFSKKKFFLLKKNSPNKKKKNPRPKMTKKYQKKNPNRQKKTRIGK